MRPVLAIPSCLPRNGCRVPKDQCQSLLKNPDKVAGCCPGWALVPPGTGSSVANGSGFHHNGHLWDGVKAVHRPRSRFQDPAHAGRLQCGMFLHPFPCRKVVTQRSLAPPSSFVRQELSLGKYQYAIWRDSWSSTKIREKLCSIIRTLPECGKGLSSDPCF